MKGVSSMRLIVGLGNPGNDYVKTRHNVGFMYLDYIFGNQFTLNKKFNALDMETMINGEKVVIVKPLSYMNLSGEVVLKYINYYKIPVNNVLIIQDDLDMETGKVKLLFNHGDGGHNGIKNIILNLKSREFLRLKIGISKIDNINTKDYVLGKFSDTELDELNKTFNYLDNFIYDYINLNMDMLIGKYNSRL